MIKKRIAPQMVQMRSVLARNTLWMSFGQGARLVIQAAYFTVIARSLGVRNYGAFVGVVAVVGILCPFASLGRGNLLIRNVARDKELFSEMWGKALSTIAVFGMVLVGLALLVAHFALPEKIPLELVLLVAVADVIGMNIITVSGQAFQSFEKLKWMAIINLLISASRLAGALILWSADRNPTALEWGYVYLASTASIALASSFMASIRLGAPSPGLPRSWFEVREGLYFSIGMSAQTIYNDIDKTMLARLSTLSATGIYGAAYRIIDVSFAPVSALLYSAYPGFFRNGKAGIRSSLSYGKPLLLRSVGYALLVASALLICANILPILLGSQYQDAAEALRWLSPLPILKAVHYFLSDAISGAGYQGIRSAIQVGVAGFNIGINLWIIPRYSWRGAAWSSIASDALLACAISLCAFLLARAARPTSVLEQTITD